MGHCLLLACYWMVLLCGVGGELEDFFPCPAAPKFQGRARRVPLGGDDIFLPVLASTPPGKRNAVCDLNEPVYIKNRHSQKSLLDDDTGVVLSDEQGPKPNITLESSGSYASTLRLVSASNQLLADIRGRPGMLARSRAGNESTFWVLEAPDGGVYLMSYLSGLLADRNGGVDFQMEKNSKAVWMITKANGEPACSFVKPSVAIVTLPGTLHDVERHQHNMGRVIHDRERHKGSTVVVSVAFADKPCFATQWAPELPGKGWAVQYLSSQDWLYGANPQGHVGPNSLEAVDKVIDWIARVYQGVKMTVVTGFSAGAVIGLRWAIMSPVGVGHFYTSPTDGRQMQVRTVLGGFDSYEYLNAKRPALSCSKSHWLARKTTLCDSCTSFFFPEDGSRRRGRDVPGRCDGQYDRYPFGAKGVAGPQANGNYSSLAEYVQHDFKHNPEFKVIGLDGKPFDEQYPQEIVKRFSDKDVRFMLGGNDVKPCSAGHCGASCAEGIQGSNRLQRGLNFMFHLRDAVPNYEPVYGVYMNTDYHQLGDWMSHHFESWAFLERPDEATPRPWQPSSSRKEAGKHCWTDAGARPLLNTYDKCHTADSCVAKCQADTYCRGAMHSTAFGGKCWMFSEVNINECKDDGHFDMYLISTSLSKTGPIVGAEPSPPTPTVPKLPGFLRGTVDIKLQNCSALDTHTGLRALAHGIAAAAQVSASLVDVVLDCDVAPNFFSRRLASGQRRLSSATARIHYAIALSSGSPTAEARSMEHFTTAAFIDNIWTETSESLGQKLQAAIKHSGISDVVITVTALSTPKEADRESAAETGRLSGKQSSFASVFVDNQAFLHAAVLSVLILTILGFVFLAWSCSISRKDSRVATAPVPAASREERPLLQSQQDKLLEEGSQASDSIIALETLTASSDLEKPDKPKPPSLGRP